MTLTIISTYVTGMILNYLFLRWIHSDDWTVKRRVQSIIYSFLSWLNIIGLLFIALFEYIMESLNDNTKAGW